MKLDERSLLSLSHRTPRTTEHLTAAQRALVQVMRDWQFGRIENMRVEGGQPILGGGAKLVRVQRLDADRQRTQALREAEWQLKQEIRSLFEELTRLQDCLIVRLGFRHGLPVQLETAPLPDAGDKSADSVPRLSLRSPRGSRKLIPSSDSGTIGGPLL
jgi:hypothetical protein